MRFSLEISPARKGDCLLLHYGTKQEPRLMLIDGGPRNVYKPFLKPRLQWIREERKLKSDVPLVIDILMVSHVDDDHIQGILDLTKELITADEKHQKRPFDVLSIWHNSFENIIADTTAALTSGFKSHFGAASLSGDPPTDMSIEVEDGDLSEEEIVWSLKALASIAQGARLRSDCERLGIELNPEFDGGLIQGPQDAMDASDGLTFTILGPMQDELEALRKKHQEWLRELASKGMTAEEALAAYVDPSVANLSSIVALVEAGPKDSRKRILLTGDARGDKILASMKAQKLLVDGGTFDVDILKVPHHGSSNNLDVDFFQAIPARHYVFSGDGEHGNPERETLEMLLQARGDEEYTVHLTYPIDVIDLAREEDWKKEQSKEKKRQLKNPQKKVRADWSLEVNSLSGLLAAHPKLAAKIRIVDHAKPHRIVLIDT